MKKILLILPILFLMTGCNDSTKFSIGDAEAIGFEKKEQKIFQLVEAQDGWSGRLAGETVELYEYSNTNSAKVERFKVYVQEGNMSGWLDLCRVANLIMLSKGHEACKKLQLLNGENKAG